jgi:hypothetical protein
VEANRQFSLTVLQDLKAVLGAQQRAVQCLMCFPLFSDANSGPIKPIGVLNVHKNVNDEYVEKKMEDLEPLLAPYIRNLENLLWLLP